MRSLLVCVVGWRGGARARGPAATAHTVTHVHPPTHTLSSPCVHACVRATAGPTPNQRAAPTPSCPRPPAHAHRVFNSKTANANVDYYLLIHCGRCCPGLPCLPRLHACIVCKKGRRGASPAPPPPSMLHLHACMQRPLATPSIQHPVCSGPRPPAHTLVPMRACVPTPTCTLHLSGWRLPTPPPTPRVLNHLIMFKSE
jgi:hypothetical protein